VRIVGRSHACCGDVTCIGARAVGRLLTSYSSQAISADRREARARRVPGAFAQESS